MTDIDLKAIPIKITIFIGDDGDPLDVSAAIDAEVGVELSQSPLQFEQTVVHRLEFTLLDNLPESIDPEINLERWMPDNRVHTQIRDGQDWVDAPFGALTRILQFTPDDGSDDEGRYTGRGRSLRLECVDLVGSVRQPDSPAELSDIPVGTSRNLVAELEKLTAYKQLPPFTQVAGDLPPGATLIELTTGLYYAGRETLFDAIGKYLWSNPVADQTIVGWFCGNLEQIRFFHVNLASPEVIYEGKAAKFKPLRGEKIKLVGQVEARAVFNTSIPTTAPPSTFSESKDNQGNVVSRTTTQVIGSGGSISVETQTEAQARSVFRDDPDYAESITLVFAESKVEKTYYGANGGQVASEVTKIMPSGRINPAELPENKTIRRTAIKERTDFNYLPSGNKIEITNSRLAAAALLDNPGDAPYALLPDKTETNLWQRRGSTYVHSHTLSNFANPSQSDPSNPDSPAPPAQQFKQGNAARKQVTLKARVPVRYTAQQLQPRRTLPIEYGQYCLSMESLNRIAYIEAALIAGAFLGREIRIPIPVGVEWKPGRAVKINRGNKTYLYLCSGVVLKFLKTTAYAEFIGRFLGVFNNTQVEPPIRRDSRYWTIGGNSLFIDGDQVYQEIP